MIGLSVVPFVALIFASPLILSALVTVLIALVQKWPLTKVARFLVGHLLAALLLILATTPAHTDSARPVFLFSYLCIVIGIAALFGLPLVFEVLRLLRKNT